jgi:hypothetical protein
MQATKNKPPKPIVTTIRFNPPSTHVLKRLEAETGQSINVLTNTLIRLAAHLLDNQHKEAGDVIAAIDIERKKKQIHDEADARIKALTNAK